MYADWREAATPPADSTINVKSYGSRFRCNDGLRAIDMDQSEPDPGKNTDFGLRNATDKPAALRSTHRVLKSGAQLLLLEFSKPVAPLLAALDAGRLFSMLHVRLDRRLALEHVARNTRSAQALVERGLVRKCASKSDARAEQPPTNVCWILKFIRRSR